MMTANVAKEGKVAVSFWVDKELADNLDYLADKAGITKSKLLSNMVEAAVHDTLILDKIGAIWVARSYLRMRDALKNKATDYKNKMIMPDIMNIDDRE
jgi:hypothetical protein